MSIDTEQATARSRHQPAYCARCGRINLLDAFGLCTRCAVDPSVIEIDAAITNAALPSGRTCQDCAHLLRCQALFACNPESRLCDWSPSRFRPRAAAKEVRR